jgi:holo-[acyl-carrier protein] synthase
MIIGVGLDVVAVARLERSLRQDGAAFAERVFTAAERKACEGRADRVQALAGRFAAKEALFKALGSGWKGGGTLALHQVEVIAAASGKPELRLSGATADQAAALGVTRVHVTLTHEPEYAAAVVILEA